MADNVAITAGSGTSIGADEIASVKYQRVKLIHGADGVNDGDVSSANGLPVQVLSVAAGDNNIGNVDVASSALPTGASTSAKQDTIIGHLDGVEGLLTTIDADTSALAGAVSGTEVQVDVLTMPTVAVTQSGVWDEIGINDSGNSITVDATQLDVDNLNPTDDIVAIGDGTSTATVRNLAANDALNVAIVDGSGDQITSFGGGTQYTEADTDASITGTAMMMEGAANALVPAQGTAADGLLVNLGANNDVTVTNATAGNLNMTEASAASIKTAVELIDDMVVAQGTALGTTKVNLNGASVTTAAPTYTTGQISPLNLATTGALRVDIGATSANATAVKINIASGGVASGAIASGAIASGAIASGAIASGAIASGAIAAGAIAAGATSIADNEDVARAAADRLVKVAQVRVDAPPSGANVSGTEDYTQFIADLYGKTWVAGSVTEDVAHAAGESVMGAGARRIDTAASSAGTSGDWATVDASAEGALWVTTTPTTTSGCSIFRSIDLDETEEDIKTSAGNLYGYYFFNSAATTHYLKFYNATAANVTVGTTTPVLTFPLPAGAAGHISFGFPVSFATAISAAVTTGLADNDTGAPAANAVILNAFYK